MNRRTPWALVVALTAACAGTAVRTPAAPSPPPTILGSFRDDYGSTYRVSDTLFEHLPRARYRIVGWHPGQQYFIAQNDSANPGQGGRWTRVDWMPLADTGAWTWAFCFTHWDAPTADSARSSPPARRATPLTGCSGYPFTRMRPLTGDSTRQLSVQEVTGCHIVELASGPQAIELTPPDTVWLLPDTVSTRSDRVTHRLEPGMSLTFRKPGVHRSWHVVDGEVRLEWGTEFHGTALQLVPTDSGLVGTASSWSHVMRLVTPPGGGQGRSTGSGSYRLAPNPVAEVVLRRCD